MSIKINWWLEGFNTFKDCKVKDANRQFEYAYLKKIITVHPVDNKNKAHTEFIRGWAEAQKRLECKNIEIL